MKLIQFLLFAALFASLQTANACLLYTDGTPLTAKITDPADIASQTLNPVGAPVIGPADSNGQSERASAPAYKTPGS
jgi:hypothetical protein